MRLKIDFKQGRKFSNDRLILVTTKKKEPVTIFKLGLLINQLAINERQQDYDWDRLPFFFEKFIAQSIEDAVNNIDWADKEHEEHIIDICNKYRIGMEKINYDLLHRTQMKKQRQLSDYM